MKSYSEGNFDAFYIDDSELKFGMEQFAKKADIAIQLFAETNAKNLEKEAKQGRPWTDRTGDARKRLNGTVEKTSTGYRIVLAHGVDYGLWLELANEGKYGIVDKTMNLQAPLILSDMEGLLSNLRVL